MAAVNGYLLIWSSVFSIAVPQCNLSMRIGTVELSDRPLPVVSRNVSTFVCGENTNLTLMSVVVQSGSKLRLYREVRGLSEQNLDAILLTEDITKELPRIFPEPYLVTLPTSNVTLPRDPNEWCEAIQPTKLSSSSSSNVTATTEWKTYDALLKLLTMVDDMENFMLLLEDDYMPIGDAVKSELSRQGIKSTSYQTSSFYSNRDLVTSILDSKDFRSKKYILLLASLESVEFVFQQANEYEKQRGKKFTVCLTTRWVTVIPNTKDAEIRLQDAAANISNVAVLRIATARTGSSKWEHLSILSPCHTVYLHTLLWKPEGRRLSLVAYINDRCLVKKSQHVFPNVDFGLNNRSLEVIVNVYPPFIFGTKVKGKMQYSGLCIDMLIELSRSMNFSYTIVEPVDKEWGEMRDGRWTGIVGDLENEKSDMSVTPLSATPNRRKVISFSYPFYIEYTSVVLKPPSSDDQKWLTFLKPFHSYVLICVTVSLFAGTIILYTAEKLNPFNKKHSNTPVQTCSDVFWYLYGALLTQGGESLPESWAGRKFISFWWLFCIILVAIYSGNLMAFLTVSRINVPFDSIHDMVKQNDYYWGTLGGSIYTSMFNKNASDDIYRSIGNGLSGFNRTDPEVISKVTSVHERKVVSDNYAYVGDLVFLQQMKSKYCSLYIIKDRFLPLYYSVGLPLNSSLELPISDEIIRMSESGLLTLWLNQWIRKESHCKYSSASSVANAKALSLVDVQATFYVVFIGIVLSGFVLISERILHGKYFRKCVNCVKRKREDESL